MIASERIRYILKSLNAKGIISLKDIARDLAISEITVRRDFEKLETEGKLKRVVGGATLENMPEERLDAAELTMKEKITLHADDKARIARYASSLVNDGDCVFLDGGSTMVPLAEALANRKIKIVTYNTLVLRNLVYPQAEVFFVGGKYLPHYSMMVGSVAQENLKQFNFDSAFLGCSGIDAQSGVAYTTEMESLLMKRIGLQNSQKAYLLADSSKFQQRGFLKFGELGSFERIISNRAEGFEPGLSNCILV